MGNNGNIGEIVIKSLLYNKTKKKYTKKKEEKRWNINKVK